MSRLNLLLQSGAIVLALGGCRAPTEQPSSGRPDAHFDLLSGADTSLSLIAWVASDTLAMGDSLKLFVALRNGGPPRRLANNPDFFSYDVLGPNGAIVPKETAAYEDYSVGSGADVLLGTNGFVGHVANLSCYQSPLAPGLQDAPCLWRVPVNSPGTYQIVVRYRGRLGAHSDHGIEADTVRVIAIDFQR